MRGECSALHYQHACAEGVASDRLLSRSFLLFSCFMLARRYPDFCCFPSRFDEDGWVEKRKSFFLFSLSCGLRENEHTPVYRCLKKLPSNLSSSQQPPKDAADFHMSGLCLPRRRRRLHIGSSSANAVSSKRRNPTQLRNPSCMMRSRRALSKHMHACMHSLFLTEKEKTPPEHMTDDER